MSVKERLKKYIEHKEISTAAFCRAIGVSTAYASSMNKSIQPDKIASITLNFPDLNTGWLLTGEGEMLKSTTPPPPADEPLALVILRQQATIDRLVSIIDHLTLKKP
jgi:hypothetical protein